MKFKKYILDKRYLLLFYIILMSFVSLIIFLDNTVKVRVDNILYLNTVALVFLLIFLLFEFFHHHRYYANINNLIKTQKEDIIGCLPVPISNEHKLYHTLLQKIYEEQERKIEKLQEGKREYLEFITSWVHEVKTPIAVSRLVIENSEGKPQDKILISIEEELDKIENYIEQALYYSRVDAFSQDYFINETDVEKLLKEAIKKQAKTFINKSISIELLAKDAIVITDKKWLTFIIDQILTNALKYTDKKGKITVYFEKDDKEKRLIIQDNGRGIKPEDLTRVFDKGFTGYWGREEAKSTGLGLYLAKSLARKLGHDITIESIYGEYTKVVLHFPKLSAYYNVAKHTNNMEDLLRT